MIDNYDSFTYNLVQYLGELGIEVKVYRNDEINLSKLKKLDPTHIVISPGPCDPNKAGISMEVINEYAGNIPILGVCLGHQSIGQVFGGKIIPARKVMHGKTSLIHHSNQGIFENLSFPYTATRYHSLVIDKNSIPSSIEVTAWTEFENGNMDEIMGIRHKEFNVQGVQFHPESISSEHGYQLLNNFITTH